MGCILAAVEIHACMQFKPLREANRFSGVRMSRPPYCRASTSRCRLSSLVGTWRLPNFPRHAALPNAISVGRLRMILLETQGNAFC